MKIKILELYEHIGSQDDYSESYYSVTDSVGWDEVTDEEFDILRKWIQNKNNTNKNHTRWVIVKECDIKIPRILKDVVQLAKQQEEARLLEEEKRIKAADKREDTYRKKREAKEKRELAKLQEKYGGHTSRSLSEQSLNIK